MQQATGHTPIKLRGVACTVLALPPSTSLPPHLSPGPCRRSILLVSKRFNACFLSSPALWRRFTVDPQQVAHYWSPSQLEWLEKQHALLRRVAQHVAWFELRPGLTPEPFDRLAGLLTELHPAVLRMLWLLCEGRRPQPVSG
ncbi:hypothetical protein ABPG75_008564 [Micractinium tetrahymenae]